MANTFRIWPRHFGQCRIPCLAFGKCPNSLDEYNWPNFMAKMVRDRRICGYKMVMFNLFLSFLHNSLILRFSLLLNLNFSIFVRYQIPSEISSNFSFNRIRTRFWPNRAYYGQNKVLDKKNAKLRPLRASWTWNLCHPIWPNSQ